MEVTAVRNEYVDNCFNETEKFKEIVELEMFRLIPGFNPVVI